MLAQIVHPFVHPTVRPTPFLLHFPTSETARNGHFWAAFFYLQLHPFNGSFNTRLKAPVRSMRCHHCHPHTAPFSPVRPSMATCTQPLPCAHTINAPLHPQEAAVSPLSRVLRPFLPIVSPKQKEPPGCRFYRSHPAARCRRSSPVSGTCAPAHKPLFPYVD